MIDEKMALRGFLEKSVDADLLQDMIGFAAKCQTAEVVQHTWDMLGSVALGD